MPSSPVIRTWLEHIRALSVEIGPRGSTTEGERRGAEYCRRLFERLGLKASLENFRSARSIFHPHLFGSIGMLAAFGLYPLGGRLTAWIAFALSLIVLACELLELGFVNNLLRMLIPKGESQNVVAVIPPAKEHLRDLVLIGHIDTQRTPLIFRTPRWVEAYKTFTTLAFVTFALQVLVYLIGALVGGGWAWYASLPAAVCALLLALICIEAELSPFTAGANDNASAVGLVLALAEEFSARPLKHTRVYCACTGCEEVQHYGAIDFFKRYRGEMKEPRGLVFELVGVSGPGWLTREGIIIPFKSDAGLVDLAERLSAEHPEWGAYPVQINGGNTEMADCARFDVPAITLFGLTRDGEAPYWHQVGDTFDKMNPAVMEKTYAFARAMIEELDK